MPRKAAASSTSLRLWVRYVREVKLWGIFVGKNKLVGETDTPLLYTTADKAIAAASEWARSRPKVERYELHIQKKKSKQIRKGPGGKRSYPRKGDPRRSKG